MSGAKLNDFSTVDVNLTAIMDTLTQATKGHFQLSVTNFTTTDAPAIAAGSIIEVDGAVFKFDAELAITGSVTDGTVYIKLIPAADACTAEYTNTAPTWSDSKQGWYGTAGAGNHRYVVKLYLASGVYYGKHYLYTEDSFYHTQTKYSTTRVSGWTDNTTKTFSLTFDFAVTAVIDLFWSFTYVSGSGAGPTQYVYIYDIDITGAQVDIILKLKKGSNITEVDDLYINCSAVG